jgi:hypothetical protein
MPIWLFVYHDTTHTARAGEKTVTSNRFAPGDFPAFLPPLARVNRAAAASRHASGLRRLRPGLRRFENAVDFPIAVR